MFLLFLLFFCISQAEAWHY